jgi:hypothetical protein
MLGAVGQGMKSLGESEYPNPTSSDLFKLVILVILTASTNVFSRHGPACSENKGVHPETQLGPLHSRADICALWVIETVIIR